MSNTPRDLTPFEHLAESVVLTLENDAYSAAKIQKLTARAVNVEFPEDPEGWKAAEWLGNEILTCLVGERLTRTGLLGDSSGGFANQDTPQGLLWMSLVSFVDWRYVGRYFAKRYEG